jgi:hypothetical protein
VSVSGTAREGGVENFFTEPRIAKRSGNSVIYQKKLEFSSL